MATTDQDPPPIPKIDPERVALRASPRPVTRLNRRMLAVLGGTLAVLVSVGALWALRSLERAAPEQYQSELPLGARGPPVQSRLL
jgi:hypothetical protein